MMIPNDFTWPIFGFLPAPDGFVQRPKTQTGEILAGHHREEPERRQVKEKGPQNKYVFSIQQSICGLHTEGSTLKSRFQ